MKLKIQNHSTSHKVAPSGALEIIGNNEKRRIYEIKSIFIIYLLYIEEKHCFVVFF